MRDLSQKQNDSILQTIYNYEFLTHRHLRDEAKSIYEELTAGLNLSRLDVKLLAFLHEGRGYKDIHTCRKAMNIPMEDMIGMLKRLVREGAVCERITYGSERDTLYALSMHFFDDIRRCRAVRNYTEQQLHNAVADFSTKMKSGKADAEKDCRKMELIIRMNPGLQFSKGYSELEASSFPLYEKCALFLMSGYFILQGVKPLDGESFGRSWENADARVRRIGSYLDQLNEENGVQQERRAGDGSSAPALTLDMLKTGIHDLMRRGLVAVIPDEGYNENHSGRKQLYLLSEKACGKLFRGMTSLINYATLSRQADVILSCNIEAKELYFDETKDGQLEMLKKVVAPKRFASFVAKLHKNGMSGAVTALFHGASGTGKTELAKQLARESGRDIFVADAAKLYGAYWGESEKNMRELFRSFKYLSALSPQTPILLFNEADGIISKRISVQRSIDKAENAVQTIVLQELETFEGIFIATTNLADQLDDAFDRRFLFKVEFVNPSPQTAAKIWMLKIPELTPEEALYIASRFPFSGGKIDNVVKKLMLCQAVSDVSVTFQQLMELCRNEELKSEGERAYYRHFQIVRSKDIKVCELFYDEDILSVVDMLRKMVVSDRFDEMVAALKQEGLSGSVNILLHGVPGTGKTELAMQLARESGRDIYVVDVAKLGDGTIGSSERDIRELFAKFRHLHATADRSPILLFNEADGIIGRRLQVERAADKDENAIQSVLIQELETFEGIFIATTNLIGNIDEAFDRRFLFKVEFHKPSSLTAAKIWRARIPELNYSEAIALGEEFAFSGGQIDNIAKRRAICKVVYGQTPSLDDLRKYCVDEQFRARESIHSAVPTYGFSQYLG